MPALVNTKYEDNRARIHGIRLTAKSAAVAGTAPTGAVDSDVKVKISKTNREFGLRPRGVTLARTVGTAPDTFKKYLFLPVLTATQFISPTFADGATITVDGEDYIVVGRKEEDY